MQNEEKQKNNKINHFSMFNDMIISIKKKFKLYAVILFGSQARGNAHKYSDYDIVLIADFKESFVHRGSSLAKLTPKVSTDLFCYTPEEFEMMFSEFHITAMDAIHEGIVLYGDDYVLPYKTRYNQYIEKGLERRKSVLIPPQL